MLAAKLLAAAVCTACPKAQLFHAEPDTSGFSCSFYLQEEISTDIFPFLEESMKGLLKEASIETFEMTLTSAVGFLSYHGQKRKSKIIKDWDDSELVRTMKIAHYVDVIEGDCDLVKGKEFVKAFKLVDLSRTLEKKVDGYDRYRIDIKGFCASSPSSLKEEIKRIKEGQSRFHERKGREKNYFSKIDESVFLWHKEGLRLRENLIDFIKTLFTDKGFEEVDYPLGYEEEALSLSKKQGKHAILSIAKEIEESSYGEGPFMGLYDLSSITTMTAIGRSAQIILEEVLDVLELSYEKVEEMHTLYVVKDVLERGWVVATFDKNNDTLRINSIEGLLGLLIDHSKEDSLCLCKKKENYLIH